MGATAAAPIDGLAGTAWVEWVVGLMLAHVALQNGHIERKGGALAFLDAAVTAARDLPPWTTSVTKLLRAHALARSTRFSEAMSCLRQVEIAARAGLAHPAALARGNLIKTKIRYDQGRLIEAEQLLSSGLDGLVVPTANALNMRALLLGKQLRASDGEDALKLLETVLSVLAEAFGNVFLGYGDTSMLDALTFNFGNNLLRGIEKGIVPKSAANTVMEWLAANTLVCRKMGTGDDSVLGYLLLVDVALDHGYHPTDWPTLLREGLRLPATLPELVAQSLAQARQVGNRLEIAQCLRRQVRITSKASEAQSAYFESRALFLDVRRADLAQQIADEWQSRFDQPPPDSTKHRKTKKLGGKFWKNCFAAPLFRPLR